MYMGDVYTEDHGTPEAVPQMAFLGQQVFWNEVMPEIWRCTKW